MDGPNQFTTRSYLDFRGLGELKGQAARDGKAALRETAQQFEALFLQMMMKSMRDSIEKSDLVDSTHTQTYEALFDREVSLAMARRNAVGLADMLVRVQERQLNSMTTEQALQAREAGGAQAPVRRLDAVPAPMPLRDPAASQGAVPLRRPGEPMPIADKPLTGGSR
jgi:Rod binding domain-containing protein